MTLNEFEQHIDEMVADAIGQAKTFPNGSVEIEVDIKDINKIDEILDGVKLIYRNKFISDEVAWNFACSYGVLLGEMIIKEHGFKWAINDNELPVVVTDNGSFISPLTAIYKLITDPSSKDDTAAQFYQEFLTMKDEQ